MPPAPIQEGHVPGRGHLAARSLGKHDESVAHAAGQQLACRAAGARQRGRGQPREQCGARGVPPAPWMVQSRGCGERGAVGLVSSGLAGCMGNCGSSVLCTIIKNQPTLDIRPGRTYRMDGHEPGLQMQEADDSSTGCRDAGLLRSEGPKTSQAAGPEHGIKMGTTKRGLDPANLPGDLVGDVRAGKSANYGGPDEQKKRKGREDARQRVRVRVEVRAKECQEQDSSTASTKTRRAMVQQEKWESAAFTPQHLLVDLATRRRERRLADRRLAVLEAPEAALVRREHGGVQVADSCDAGEFAMVVARRQRLARLRRRRTARALRGAGHDAAPRRERASENARSPSSGCSSWKSRWPMRTNMERPAHTVHLRLRGEMPSSKLSERNKFLYTAELKPMYLHHFRPLPDHGVLLVPEERQKAESALHEEKDPPKAAQVPSRTWRGRSRKRLRHASPRARDRSAAACREAARSARQDGRLGPHRARTYNLDDVGAPAAQLPPSTGQGTGRQFKSSQVKKYARLGASRPSLFTCAPSVAMLDAGGKRHFTPTSPIRRRCLESGSIHPHISRIKYSFSVTHDGEIKLLFASRARDLTAVRRLACAATAGGAIGNCMSTTSRAREIQRRYARRARSAPHPRVPFCVLLRRFRSLRDPIISQGQLTCSTICIDPADTCGQNPSLWSPEGQISALEITQRLGVGLGGLSFGQSEHMRFPQRSTVRLTSDHKEWAISIMLCPGKSGKGVTISGAVTAVRREDETGRTHWTIEAKEDPPSIEAGEGPHLTDLRAQTTRAVAARRRFDNNLQSHAEKLLTGEETAAEQPSNPEA
ncbi:hypothetical protein AURDEDRAFT_126495 [Auricularia subglabra TFB-10046 SS5]|nr:hypothetical protein AURDEDRAFT_126495 [Auricularia subglabra TFB-10046 SS5]